MSSNSESIEKPFEANDEICQKLVEEFVQMTDTNEALAQFYLQDRNWNLRLSVNDYFDQISKEKSKPIKHKSEDIVISSDDSNDGYECDIIFDGKSIQNESNVGSSSVEEKVQLMGMGMGKAKRAKVISEVKQFRFICWNIDGIDEKNLVIRTEAVSRFIREENAFIVFLQEVVPQSESILRKSLSDYEFFSGNNDSVDYYTLTAIHRKYVELINNQIIEFRNTSMGRNLLKTTVRIGSALICLLNTHLESTKDFAKDRVRQLNEVFKYIETKTSNNESVIFGGDLNLRDKEIAETNGIPKGVYDVWIKTGARKEVEFTWDLLRNDNLQFMGSRFKPRFRFDRVFVRPSVENKIDATHFGLIGLERLKPYVCFPSDHWGLRVHFEII